MDEGKEAPSRMRARPRHAEQDGPFPVVRSGAGSRSVLLGPRSGLWTALLVTSALVYLVLTIHAARIETPTVDEFAHLPAGAAYWRHGDFDLYAKNPPLLKLWMSAPVAADPTVSVPRPTRHADAWAPWDYGTVFMNANRPHYLDIFFRARLMVILLGLLTAGILVLWARRLYSPPTVATLGSLFLLSPTILAHSHLATVDIGCALTVLLSVWTLRWALQAGSRQPTRSPAEKAKRSARRQPGWWRMAIAGGGMGLALSVKYTAVLLVPVVIALVLLTHARRSGCPAGSRARSAMRDVGIVLLVALLVVNAAAGFAGCLRSLGAYEFSSAFAGELQSHLPAWLPVPLPSSYIAGFDSLKQDAEKGEYGSYLMGRWSETGWWYYNLFALLVKEPETFLIVLILTPLFFVRFWRNRADREDAWFLLIPAIVLFVSLSMLSRLNFGLRYVLPAMPFLYLLMGPAVEAMFFRGGKWLVRLGTGLLIGYSAAAAIATHPGHLSYFNLISGGPRNGPNLLLDSNTDWGQDLYRVRGLSSQLRSGERLGLLYFGHVDPGIYGIEYDPVPPQPVPGLLAVSVNFLYGYPYFTPLPGGQLGMVEPEHLQWLRSHRPVAKLGSIWVFDTREP